MGKNQVGKKINCHKCIHFYVTWDPKHPYGCRSMGFKGTQLPSIVVLKFSGEPCMLFKGKQSKSR